MQLIGCAQLSSEATTGRGGAACCMRERSLSLDILLVALLWAVGRQYAWGFVDDRWAWIAVIPAILVVVALRHRASTKGGVAGGAPAACGDVRSARVVGEAAARLLYICPLALLAALRVGLPDDSFDVVDYHLTARERAFHGYPWQPGDFFPTGTVNPQPTPELIFAALLRIVGYRLSPLVNLVAILAAGGAGYRLLRVFVASPWWRASGVLVALCTEQVLAQAASTMVDVLALPLLLEATRQLHLGVRRGVDVLEVGLLLGLAAGSKISNGAFVLPLVLWAIVSSWRRSGRALHALRTAIVMGVLAAVPLLPHFVFLYRETGSPLFPWYNSVFRSPLWGQTNLDDSRFGPDGAMEALTWPVLSALDPRRLGEIPPHARRLAVVAIIAVLLLAVRRLRSLALIWVVCAVLWSVSSGYMRYGMFLEVLGSIQAMALIGQLWRRGRFLPRAGTVVVAALLAVQGGVAVISTLRHDGSSRPIALEQWPTYRSQWSMLGRDRSIGGEVPVELRRRLRGAKAWVLTDRLQAPRMVLLDPTKPIVNTCPWYRGTPEAQSRFGAAIARSDDGAMASICEERRLPACLAWANGAGLHVKEAEPVEVSFFGVHQGAMVVLWLRRHVEVADPRFEFRALVRGIDGTPRAAVSLADASGPSGSLVVVQAAIANIGRTELPGDDRGAHAVELTPQWILGDGEVVNAASSMPLSRTLRPGQRSEFEFVIKTPRKRGGYRLRLGMSTGGVPWTATDGGAATISVWRRR